MTYSGISIGSKQKQYDKGYSIEVPTLGLRPAQLPYYGSDTLNGVSSDISEHPTDNPDLPCYFHPEYKARLSTWRFMFDVFEGRSAWFDAGEGKITDKKKAQTYLPRENKESEEHYLARIKRSPYRNFLAPVIEDFEGLLTDWKWSGEILSSIAQSQDDCDLKGHDWITAISQADRLTLRDGACGLMVDFPMADPNILTRQDELVAPPRRPYLSVIDIQHVVNWSVCMEYGKPVIDMLVLRTPITIKDGKFGTKSVTSYRVFEKQGTLVTYEDYVIKKKKDIWVAIQICDTQALSISVIPFVYYSITNGDFFEAWPAFQEIAENTVHHYQINSEHRALLHGLNMPVPVRKGLLIAGMQDQNLPSVTLGPSSLIDVPVDGDFYFAEPTGNSAAANMEFSRSIENAAEKRSLEFLGIDQAHITATQVRRESGSLEASLGKLARQKESALQQVAMLWQMWTGESGELTCTVNKSILVEALDPQTIQALSALNAASQLSLQTLLLMLQQGKVIPASINLDDEEKLISSSPAPIVNLAPQ
jgi:hypothetical protein